MDKGGGPMAKGGLLFEIRQGVSVRSWIRRGNPGESHPNLESFFFLSSGPHQGPGRRHGGRKK